MVPGCRPVDLAFTTKVESLIAVSSISTSKVTDMFEETGTFSSFCAGEVETIWGVWAEAGTAQKAKPVRVTITNTISIKLFLDNFHLRKNLQRLSDAL
jgi:hypothetical protein